MGDMFVHEWITLQTGFVFPDWFWGWQVTVLLYVILLLGIGELISIWFAPSKSKEETK